MAIYMDFDGGGTKLAGIVYNDRLELLGYGRSGGTMRFSPEEVKRHILDCLDQMLPPDVTYIEKAYVIVVSVFDDFEDFKAIVRSRVDVGEFVEMVEPQGAMLAGACQRTGLVALAGTGSGAFYTGENKGKLVGARGPIFGDEGSGTWLGRHAFAAVCHELDGWGEKTLLTDLFIEHLGITRKPDEWVCQIYQERSPFAKVASVVPLLGQAAAAGDKVALSIIEKGATLMGQQIVALMNQIEDLPENPIIILHGGVWKVHPLYQEIFIEYVHRFYPNANPRLPWFDQIGFGLALCALDQGMSDMEAARAIAPALKDFVLFEGWEK